MKRKIDDDEKKIIRYRKDFFSNSVKFVGYSLNFLISISYFIVFNLLFVTGAHEHCEVDDLNCPSYADQAGLEAIK